jgi:NAD(P)-dependent dehydrogenase (short-subunit alcohol dehydrogenase family)
MSMLPGLYFVLPQIFPTPLGIPAYRDYFYPVLAFLIMLLMLNEQKEKEMDSIFTLAVTKANIPLRRFGRATDIAEAVCFLASQRANFITGQLLRVDGGYSV